MRSCRAHRWSPWSISGQIQTEDPTCRGLDVAYLDIRDRGGFAYHDVLRMVEAGDVAGIGAVGDGHDLLLRICTDYVADVQEEHGPYVFGAVEAYRAAAVTRRAALIRALRSARPERPVRPVRPARHARQGGTLRAADRSDALVHEARQVAQRLGAWVLSEPAPDPDPTVAQDRLVFAAHAQPVRLSIPEVQDIVTQEAWWRIPGWNARWEILLRCRCRSWLLAATRRHRQPYLPWTVTVIGGRYGPAPALMLSRDGRTCRLSPCEARDIDLHGGWDRIPGYEPSWQWALAEELSAFWWSMEPPW